MELLEIFSAVFVTITTVTSVALYIYYKRSFKYFDDLNIPVIKPTFPLGSIKLSFFRQSGQALEEYYHIFKQRGEKIGGVYIFTKPLIIPTDRDVIRDVLTKNYQDFNTRGMYYNEEKEFLTAHLAAISGGAWKALRSKLTPAFSSGKLKLMFPIILDKISKLERKLDEFHSTKTPFDCKEIGLKITTDIFCSLFLGIECNTLINPNEVFPTYANKLFKTNVIDGVRMALMMNAPDLVEALNLKFIRKDLADFFIKSMEQVVEHREKNSVEPNDFMSLLIRLKNRKDMEDGKTNISAEESITQEQLIANCMLFYIAGVDTSATTIGYCLYELTQNQSLQDDLREEINSVLKKHNDEITYECVMEMKLLDRVLCETLRKYPSVAILNRKCIKDYQVPGTNMCIEKGAFVFVSLLGLHRDPEYYPDPEKFDPDRFTEEEKAKRLPFTYMPFGDGPRMCLGLRLGIIEVKLGMIFFLRNHKFTLNPKTKLPIQFMTETVLLAHHGNIWLNTHKIS